MVGYPWKRLLTLWAGVLDVMHLLQLQPKSQPQLLQIAVSETFLLRVVVVAKISNCNCN